MHYLPPKKEIEEHERDWAVGAHIEGYCCYCAHDTTHEVTAIEGLLIT